MDAKLILIALCVWLVLSDILIDPGESFNIRKEKRRRRRRRRRRAGKKRDFISPDAKGKRAIASNVWVCCLSVSNVKFNAGWVEQTGFALPGHMYC